MTFPILRLVCERLLASILGSPKQQKPLKPLEGYSESRFSASREMTRDRLRERVSAASFSRWPNYSTEVPSLRPCPRPSVPPSARPSVRASVRFPGNPWKSWISRKSGISKKSGISEKSRIHLLLPHPPPSIPPSPPPFPILSPASPGGGWSG